MSDTEYCRYETDESLPGELERHSCIRTVWNDASDDYCRWHTDQKEKPAEELLKARADGRERLDRAKLRGVDLTDIPLKSAVLVKANLRYAILEGKDFREADLRKVDFLGANLAGADFRSADMWEIDFREAEVSNANFRCADCRGSILRGLDLRGENCYRVNLSSADLQDIRAKNVVLFEATLRNADCSDSKFPSANLRYADCSNADFSDADLSEAHLTGANFSEATLQGADFSEATLRNVDLSGADLRDADLTHCLLEGATLTGADLRGTDLSKAKIHSADFGDVEIDHETEFGGISAYERNADRAAADCDELPSSSWKEPFWTIKTAMTRFKRRRCDGFLFKDSDGEPVLRKSIDSYRTVQRLLQNSSVTGKIANYHVREKQAERKLKCSKDKCLGWLELVVQRWVMLYGERPWRVIGTSMLVILLAAFVYPLATFKSNSEPVLTYSGLSVESLGVLLDSVYFSTITFITLGYGGLTPYGWARGLAMVESFVGTLLASLLLFVLTRRAKR